jgi:hypothetical protein
MSWGDGVPNPFETARDEYVERLVKRISRYEELLKDIAEGELRGVPDCWYDGRNISAHARLLLKGDYE